MTTITLSEHMYKKFEIDRAKIKGSCQSGRNVVTYDSKSNLPLVSKSLLLNRLLIKQTKCSWDCIFSCDHLYCNSIVSKVSKICTANSNLLSQKFVLLFLWEYAELRMHCDLWPIVTQRKFLNRFKFYSTVR